MDSALHIDLLNIDNDHFEGYQYVLTSPRSLEACSRLGVKPVELLSKTLTDVKEELLPSGVSMRAIYDVFNEQERERLNKLHLCIEEWQRIIAAGKPRVVQQSDKAVGTENGSQWDDDVLSLSENGECSDLECLDLESSNRPADRGSLERARTAWTTSIGHERVTLQELEDRANKLHELGKALDARSAGRASRTKRRRRTRASRPTSTVHSSDDNEVPRTHRMVRRSHSDLGYSSSRRASSQDSIASSSVQSSRASVRSGSVRSGHSSPRSKIVSEASDVTLITDPQLKKKLKSVIAPDTRLKTKDQKILSLMVAKREAARHDIELSKASQSMWKDERTRQQTAAEIEENRRRQKLAAYRRKESLLKAQIEARRRENEEEAAKLRERHLEETLTISSLSLHRQRQQQVQKLIEKQRTELKKKILVAAKRDENNRDLEEYSHAIVVKQQQDVEHANSVKLNKEQQIALRTKIKNRTSQQKHRVKMTEIQQQSCDQTKDLCASLDLKHQHIQEKQTAQQQRKQIQLQQKQKEVDMRIVQSRLKQLEMEEEIKGWHDKLDDYRRLQETRADNIAKEAAAEKSRRASTDRIERERMQREKMKKLTEDEDQWKRDMKTSIAMKETRVAALQADREEMIKQSRNLAGSSQRLRDAVKHKYSTYDLEDLNKQATHENKFLYRTQYNLVKPSIKNLSTIFLG